MKKSFLSYLLILFFVFGILVEGISASSFYSENETKIESGNLMIKKDLGKKPKRKKAKKIKQARKNKSRRSKAPDSCPAFN